MPKLSRYAIDDPKPTSRTLEIDLRTAVDVAIRDLQEIEAHWGSELALKRLSECQAMLRIVLEAS